MNAWVRGWLCTGLGALSLSCGGRSAAAEHPVETDRPLRIIKRADLRFPPRALALGITSGEVRLFLRVDAEGKLSDHLFVAFTHHEFANEVSRTVPHWTYEPALAGGRPLAAIAELTIRFRNTGVVVTERRGLEETPPRPDVFMFRARELVELDRVPRRLFAIPPANPAAPDEPAITGRATVDFYIDEQGNVRMPVVADADDERLGWVALAAVAKWQFEIPRRSGHPVLARASQVFVFSPGG